MKLNLSFKNFDNHYNILLKKRCNKCIRLYTYKLKKICNINLNFFSDLKKIKKYTLLSSPHIDKKSREQFEYLFYKLLINFKINVLITKSIKKLRFFMELYRFFLLLFNFILQKFFDFKGIYSYLNFVKNFTIFNKRKNSGLNIKLLWVKK